MSQKQAEETAYKTLNAVLEALDYVAAKPELTPQLAYELIQKAPKIYEAIMTITKPEDRPIIHELFKKALNLTLKLTEKKRG